jgi:hypothetical protein
MKRDRKADSSALEGVYTEVGSPKIQLIIKGNTCRLGSKDIHLAGTFTAKKVDEYTYLLKCVLSSVPSDPDLADMPEQWKISRRKATYILEDEMGDERMFKRKGDADGSGSGLADSTQRVRAKAARVAAKARPRPVSDFIEFIADWGHPEWIVLAAEAPAETVARTYASLCSARKSWANVPVCKNGKDDAIAPLSAVVQPKGSDWSVIYRILCLPIQMADLDEANKIAKSLSAKLKTRALSFIGEDTSGAMGYRLFRGGKEAQEQEWESQTDPADDDFAQLGLRIPPCYPRQDGKTICLVALHSWLEEIERADVVDVGEL